MATIGKKTLIVLCICFCIIAVLNIAVKGIVNARTHEYTITCESPKDFYAWHFSEHFFFQIPPTASDISAMACPGTSLFNVDYKLSMAEFNALGVRYKWSNIISGSNLHVRAFHRYGEDSIIAYGYYVQPTNLLSKVTIGIWYDKITSCVMLRQCGFVAE